MSVEAGISQGVAEGISTAVATGGASVEAGVASAFSAPDISGGSFNPNISMESLFSDTVPFTAFEGPIFDRSIANPNMIFSQKSDFLTFAKNADSFKTSSMPFEASLDLSEGEWSNVEPQSVVLDRRINIDLKELSAVASNQALGKDSARTDVPQAIAEIPKADLVQAQKVADILVSLGSGREEAQNHVLEIVRQANGAAENVGKIVLERQAQGISGEALADVNSLGKAAAVSVDLKTEEEREEEEEEDEEEKKKKKKKKPQADQEKLVELALIVDESAQVSRKNTFKERLSKAFQQARERGLSIVRGRDVVAGLSEKKQDKSDLLIQAGYKDIADGSFYAITDEVAESEFSNVVTSDQPNAEAEVDSIINTHPGVKISEIVDTRLASKDEEKKVMMFVNSSLPLAA